MNNTDINNNHSKGLILLNTNQKDIFQSRIISLTKYIDTLIRLLPGFSNQELCSAIEECKSKNALQAKLEQLRLLHGNNRFAVIIKDDELNVCETDQALADTITDYMVGMQPLTRNLGILHLDKEQNGSELDHHGNFNVRIAKENNDTEGQYLGEINGKTGARFSNYWPSIGTQDLRKGLTNIAQYLIRIAQELKLIPQSSVEEYSRTKLENLVDMAIHFTREDTDVSCLNAAVDLDSQTSAYRNILLKNLSLVLDSTGIINENGILYFNETRQCAKWCSLTNKRLCFFPNSAYIQKILGKTEVTSREGLREILRSLGFRVATDEQEKLRYGKILEDNWSRISNATGIYRIKDHETKRYKYYFHLGHSNTAKYKWPKVPGGHNLSAFPDSRMIRSLINRKTIFTLDELKTVWMNLGLMVAREDEDNASTLRNQIVKRWKAISERTGIQRIIGLDGQEKYYFNSCIKDPGKWGGIDSIPMKNFPSGLFVQQAIAKDCIDTPEELKLVWKKLGLKVASKTEESLVHLKKLIINNWAEISNNTGIDLLPDIDGNYKYYFGLCKKDPEQWGSVAGIALKDFPSTDYIRSIISKDSITNPAELKLIWGSLGIDNIASENEENYSQIRALLEANWQAVSDSTGIYRIFEKNGQYGYYFDNCKDQTHLWAKLVSIPLKDFPSPAFIQGTIGQPSINTPDELKEVWKRLGLNVKSNEEAEQIARRSYQRKIIENIKEIIASTGVVYENGIFYFDDCVDKQKWCKIDGKALANFPNPKYISQVTGRRITVSGKLLKEIFKSLGFRVANDNEELLCYGRKLENEWGKAKISKNTGIERRYDPVNKCFKYYFLLAKTTSDKHKWPKVAARNLEYYPGAQSIRSILKDKSHISNIPELKKVWEALGLKIATPEEEVTELPRKLIEENWQEISKNTQILRLADMKYYFSQARSTAQNWGRVPGCNGIRTFPNSATIMQNIGEPYVQSAANLKRLWSSFGLEMAAPEEEAALPKKLIELNWREISRNTGITQRLVQEGPNDEPKIKYFFRFAKGASHWGWVADIKTLRSFPNPDLIRSVIKKDKIETIKDLKLVWEKLGIEVANEEEENNLMRWVIEDSWSNITKHTGVILVQTFNGLTYHFGFARPRNEWGRVRAANDRNLEAFPSGPEIKSILSKSRIDSPNDLRQVWSELGLNVATPEEEYNLPKVLIEEFNWDHISKNTGVKRVQDVQGFYTYDFSTVKDPSEWGTMPGVKISKSREMPLVQFPSPKFIREVLGEDDNKSKTQIQSKDELAKIWKALGLRVS